MKPDYIKNLEKEVGILSIIKQSTDFDNFDKFDNNKNLELIYSEADFSKSKVVYKNKLYKSSSDFFIFCEMVTVPPFGQQTQKYNILLNIYHKPPQINEVTIYLIQLNKK